MTYIPSLSWNVSWKFNINLFIAIIMKFWTSFYKLCSQMGGGRKFERPNGERLIFRNLKITGEGQNFKQ